MADLFWLSDAQWVVIEPFMPKNQPGPSAGTTDRSSRASYTRSQVPSMRRGRGHGHQAEPTMEALRPRRAGMQTEDADETAPGILEAARNGRRVLAQPCPCSERMRVRRALGRRGQ